MARRELTWGPFPVTAWDLVRGAAGRSGDGRLALDDLWRRYSIPLRFHIVTHWKLQVTEAEEILQDFAIKKILIGDLLSKADPARGRFRSFLLASMDNFVVDHFRRTRPADFSPPKEQTNDDPARQYEREWARTVLWEAIENAKTECMSGDRLAFWQVFEERVLKPAQSQDAGVNYAQLAGDLGFDSAAQASNALVTVKRIVDRNLRQLLAQDLGQNSDQEQELDELRRLLVT